MTVVTSVPCFVYIASLADYNAGRLHGRWVECSSEGEVWAAIGEILDSSPEGGEEWAVHDYDGFGALNLGEFPSVDELCEVAAAIMEHGDPVAAFLAAGLGDLGDFEGRYYGEWSSFRDYVYEYVADTGMLAGVADEIARYFDYEAFARDLACDYSIADSPDGVYVFCGY